jgi:hypothetical protein
MVEATTGLDWTGLDIILYSPIMEQRYSRIACCLSSLFSLSLSSWKKQKTKKQKTANSRQQKAEKQSKANQI